MRLNWPVSGHTHIPKSSHFAGSLADRSSPGLAGDDWLVGGAVRSEPVSTANSLLTGKITGNFDDSRPPRSPFERNKRHFTALWSGTRRFGNRELFRRNREFLEVNMELIGIDQRSN